MFQTLYAKLALALILLLSAVGLLYAFISTSATRAYLQEVSQRFNRDLARNLVADRNLVAEGQLDQAALKETFRQYMVINPSIEIYLLDLEGAILAYSADPGKVKRNSVSLEPIQAFLQGEGGYPLLGDDPRNHDRRKAFSVTPVPSARNPEGYLYVVLRGEEFESAEQVIRESFFMRLSGWAVAGSLLFGLLTGLLLFRLLTRRLQRLSSVMETFQGSHFATHAPYQDKSARRADEIDRIGITFDRMAERISTQIDQLREQDTLRRELVAHVSHDLRTPLASLHGYLESLQLKQATVAPEEQATYLSVALRQSERLRRLVEELFELARLDARETHPRSEPFAPSELVQDVLQKFRLRAEHAAITLTMDAPPAIPLVLADIALTERVLDNLIGNALDHSQGSSSVQVILRPGSDQVIITVADHGRGIAASDLPHLFEPFFRGDGESRSGSHAGLGLAIARRIVELQGGRIHASSRPGRGSLFSFTLPQWQQGGTATSRTHR